MIDFVLMEINYNTRKMDKLPFEFSYIAPHVGTIFQRFLSVE